MTGGNGCAIAVMAKAPRPGLVKTRLTPFLHPEEAAQMSAAFLRDITTNIALAAQSAAISPWIAYAPAGSAALFDGMLAPGTRLVLADGTIPAPLGVEGFGRCLLHAVLTLLDGDAAAVCLLNSDSPTLPTALLVQAAQALAAPGDRVVLGPAEDGGYYLIGMKRPHAGLFANIDWSTDRVAQQTRDRAAASGLEVVELATWFDVDDAAAMRRLIAPQPHVLQAYAAPCTTALVSALGLERRLEAAVSVPGPGPGEPPGPRR